MKHKYTTLGQEYIKLEAKLTQIAFDMALISDPKSSYTFEDIEYNEFKDVWEVCLERDANCGCCDGDNYYFEIKSSEIDDPQVVEIWDIARKIEIENKKAIKKEAAKIQADLLKKARAKQEKDLYNKLKKKYE